MNKNKINEFIEKLQVMAAELNAEEQTKTEEISAYDVREPDISGFEYLTYYNNAGEVLSSPVKSLRAGGSFTASFDKTIFDSGDTILRFGFDIPFSNFKIYDPANGELIFNMFGDRFYFDLPIYQIYEKTGDTKFKLQSTEAINIESCYKTYKLTSIEVRLLSTKSVFLEGEALDERCVEVYAVTENNVKWRTNNFKVSSTGNISAEKDNVITVEAYGYSKELHINDVLVPADPFYGVAIEDFESKYIKIPRINGSPVFYGGVPLNVRISGDFDVEVDIEQLLKDKNKTMDMLDDCILHMPGKTHESSVTAYVCAANSNERLFPVSVLDEVYHISLKKIYDKTGTVNFRFFIENPVEFLDKESDAYIDNSPHEVFSAVESWFTFEYGAITSLSIKKPANKTGYFAGEKFDSSGLVLNGIHVYGAESEVKSFTVEPAGALLPTDTKVVIKSGNLSVEHPINIIGQRINSDYIKIQNYTRNKNSGVWSGWMEDLSAVKYLQVDKTDNREIKTLISIPLSKIALGNREEAGLRLKLNRVDDYYDKFKRIKINGIEHALPKGERQNYLYIGSLSAEALSGAGAGENLKIELEYVDSFVNFGKPVEFELLYCSSAASATESEKKEFELAGNSAVSVDVLSGNGTFVFNDIAPDATLLNVGISHVFAPAIGNNDYGRNFRLNLYERLEFSKQFNGPLETPVFTDAAGEKHAFTNLYYYESDGEYVRIEEKDFVRLKYDKNGNLLFDDKPVVITNAIVQGFMYLYSTDETIENNPRYRQLKAENNPDTLPVHWLKSARLYKGYNESGRFVIAIDVYNHFTEMRYDALGRLDGIADKNNNVILLEYNTDGYLGKIKYALGRTEYAYKEGKLETVKYYNDRIDGYAYKTVTFKYEEVAFDGSKTCAISDIISTDNTHTQIKYERLSDFESRIEEITNYTSVPGSAVGASEKIQTGVYFEYDNESRITNVFDRNGNCEKYVFGDSAKKKEYYQIFNHKVSKAEFYEYPDKLKQVVTELGADMLNKFTYEQLKESERLCLKTKYDCPLFTYNNINASLGCSNNCLEKNDKKIMNTTLFNDYNYPIKVVRSNEFITADVIKSTITDYEYDREMKMLQERTTETFMSKEQSYVNKYITDYTYDETTGLLAKKTTTVISKAGETAEQTDYVKTEEYGYDEHGCVNKVKTYTDAGEIYFTEKEFNANRQLVKEYDPTGENYVQTSYKKGTNLIETVKAPNNNIYNYVYNGEHKVEKLYGTASGSENANWIAYKGENISKLDSSKGNLIEFEYDAKHRPLKIKLDGKDYESYRYYENIRMGKGFGDEVIVTNANGEAFMALADAYGQSEEAYYNGKLILQRYYDNSGNLAGVTDKLTNTNYVYEYDDFGNRLSYTEMKPEVMNKEKYTYNDRGLLSKVQYSGEVTREDAYSYTSSSTFNVVAMKTGDYNLRFGYDTGGRYIGKTVRIGSKQIDSESVSYVKVNDHATVMPLSIAHNDSFIQYTYDENGNISQIDKDRVMYARYGYDTLGRLIREDNKDFNKSWFYAYDNNGNIVSKEECAFTLESHTSGTGSVEAYTYEKDRLENYGGESITYDKVGNPLTYRGNALKWERGRKLVEYGTNKFRYDAQGRRTAKNGINYVYDSNDRLIAEGSVMEYFYDITGLMGFKYGNEQYVYRKDAQGNITAILDSSGAVVVEYYYDAWGNHKWTGDETLAKRNPFRYRGYYYDEETGLYFLKSRYYDPKIGRFINIDSVCYIAPELLNGLNLYAYCLNNPVMYVDPYGTFLISIGATIALSTLGVLGIGAAVEIVFHPIEKTINNISNWVGDLYFDFEFNTNKIGIIEKSGIFDNLTIATSGLADSFVLNYVQAKNKGNSDPNKRPGQKKTGRERKNKARKKDNWEERGGRRRIPPLKHHTPGRDHRKYLKMIFWLNFLILYRNFRYFNVDFEE